MNDTENLIFSLNATMPVFLLMVLGYVLQRKTLLLNEQFADYLNTFVFKLALPVQLFKSLSQEDFHAVWDGGIVLFCFGVSLASILLLLGLSAFCGTVPSGRNSSRRATGAVRRCWVWPCCKISMAVAPALDRWHW